MKNKKVKSNVFNVLNAYNIGEIELEDKAESKKELPEAKPTTKKDRRGRPKKKDLVRENGAQQGLPPSEIRKTYIMDIKIVEQIEEYADQTGQTIKDTINGLLEEALEGKLQ